MHYSPEDRRKAAEQLEDIHRLSRQHSPDEEWLSVAIIERCQLNAAVELLRSSLRALEVAGYSPTSVSAFLADFPVPEVETKR